MSRVLRAAAVLLIIAIAFTGCKKERPAESEAFKFVVYPGAQYLSQLTELTKQAQTIYNPNAPTAATAIYDTDAPLEQVANYYAKEYGFGNIAPDATNNLSAAKPRAYYRVGDLHADNEGIAPVLAKLKITADLSKAQGKYRSAEIDRKPNRPHVTVQRPYFDLTKSQVVDRTIILMAR